MELPTQVFVGFGFLMTFLRRYCFGAVALNMAASAVVFLEAILVVGAMQQVGLPSRCLLDAGGQAQSSMLVGLVP